MEIDLYLVRHGETEWNAEGRIQGGGDSPLTARGRAQADAVGRLLAGHFQTPPDAEISPLGRTRATFDLINRHLAVARATPQPLLREVTLGVWDGLTVPEIRTLFPDTADEIGRTGWFFRAPKGETLEETKDRAARWLASLPSRPVVAVSHGLTGRVIRALYLGLGIEEMMELPVPQDTVWHLHGGRIEGLQAECLDLETAQIS